MSEVKHHELWARVGCLFSFTDEEIGLLKAGKTKDAVLLALKGGRAQINGNIYFPQDCNGLISEDNEFEGDMNSARVVVVQEEGNIATGVDECPYGKKHIDEADPACGACEFFNECEVAGGSEGEMG